MTKAITISYLDTGSQYIEVESNQQINVFTRDINYLLNNGLKGLARLEGIDATFFINPETIAEIKIQDKK